MPDLNTIRERLADNARTGEVRAFGYAPDEVTGPAVVIDLPDYRSLSFGRNYWTIPLDAHLLVARQWDRTTSKKIDELIPVLWTALESDKTLGGAAESLHVVQFTARRSTEAGGFDFVGGVFEMEVIAT